LDLVRERWISAYAAGAVLGIAVLGVGGRLAMATIQVAQGAPPGFDLAGTVQVLVPGLAVGPAAGLWYALLLPWIGKHATALRGIIFGTCHGAFWVAVYFARPAGPVELSAAPVFGSILFGTLLILFGVAVAWLEARWHPRLATLAMPVGARAFLWLLGAAGFGFTFWVLVQR
jgi:hypothetical protein